MKRFQFKRSDKNTSTMFRVPNNKAGQKFIELMKMYAAVGTRISVRGRGPRAKHVDPANGRWLRSLRQSLPLFLAESFAVYVQKTAFQMYPAGQLSKMYHDMAIYQESALQVPLLKQEIQRLERDRAELMQQREAVKKSRDAMLRQRDEYREQMDVLHLQLDQAMEELAIYRSTRPEARGTTINVNHLTIIAGNA